MWWADETNEVSYEVTARRRLTYGEIYSAIRVPLFKFGANVCTEGRLQDQDPRWE